MRSRQVFVFAILSALSSTSPLLANDYAVDFGIDTPEGKDAGTLACTYDRLCGVTLNSLRLRFSIQAFRGGKAHVFLYSDNVACCYFKNAASSLVLDPKLRSSRTLFYEGRPARGGLFIQNKQKGVLYLRFAQP